jgi:hypothetical protein
MFCDDTLKYSTFVEFNPFVRNTDWDKIATMAENYFLKFINAKDYGENVISTRFVFLVEKEIDINNQDDFISTSTYWGITKNARLTLHLDFNYFTNASKELQYQIVVNGILFLLNYWKNNLKIPKGTPLDEIICDYKNKLAADELLNDSIEEIYIKIKNPFRFEFMLYNFHETVCHKIEDEIKNYTKEIEKYLNNNLYKYDFGKSINQIYFSYDIFDFYNSKYEQYIDNKKEYKYGKNKDLSIMEQFDSNLFEDKTKYEQIEYMQKGMLEAISRIELMKRKPKYFNVKYFYEIIDNLMNKYKEKI